MRGNEHVRRRILKLKGKFGGQRCFIVGNGPSLARTPLELLRDDFSFGLNKIAEIYSTTSWRPDFYVAVGNSIAFTSMTPWYKKAVQEAPLSFVTAQHLHLVCEEAEPRVYDIPRSVIPVVVSFKHHAPTYDPEVWSYDISERVSKDGSSITAVMQIAVYLGFNPIYLIGCDLGLKAWDWMKEDDPNHFSGDYWGGLRKKGKPYKMDSEHAKETTEFLEMGHRISKTVCDSIGVEVYNATLGGVLETYPRVNFEELFE